MGRITRHDLQRLLRKNPGVKVEGAGKSSKLEQDSGHAPLPTPPAKEGTTARFLVCVTDVRRRLLDEDNLCEKFHVDLLRYSGVVPSDAPSQTSIQTTQRKAAKGEEPHTEIEVFRLNASPADLSKEP